MSGDRAEDGRTSSPKWRLAARLARREVSRRPWRTVLIAALVAAPVAGMVAAAVMVRTNRLTAMQEWRFTSGHADAVVQADSNAATIPHGSRVVAFQSD